MLIWTSSFIILFSVEINFSWTIFRSIYTSLPDVLYFQLQQAHRVFHQFARGPATEKYLHQLDEACEKFWKNGRQLCEEISVTGNHCIKPVCNISRTFCFTFLFRKYKIKWLCNLHEENIGYFASKQDKRNCIMEYKKNWDWFWYKHKITNMM